MIVTNYTPEDLKKLPLRAIVALSYRCARRVEHLAVPENDDPETQGAARPWRTPFAWRRTSRTARPVRPRIRRQRGRIMLGQPRIAISCVIARWPPSSLRPARRPARCMCSTSEKRPRHRAGQGPRRPILYSTWRMSRPTWPRETPSPRRSEAVAADGHTDAFIKAAIEDYENCCGSTSGRIPTWASRSTPHARAARCTRPTGAYTMMPKSLEVLTSSPRAKTRRELPSESEDHPAGPRTTSTEGTIVPVGAAWIEDEHAYNFSLYAQHAESVVLLLFAEDDPAQPLLEYRLDPRVNKTWNVWHCRLAVRVPEDARYYAYRIDGPRPDGPGNVARLRPGESSARPACEGGLLPAGRSIARRRGIRARTLVEPRWASCRAPVGARAGSMTSLLGMSRTPW